MKSTGVFDRNGQEIHVGDRVKIRGDEVLNYLQWCFDNDLPESISQDIADYFGIAVDDDFLQIINENGDMLYDLSTNFKKPDPCLEIVTDDVKESSTTIITKNEEKTADNAAEKSLDTSLDTCLVSWFGEDGGRKMFQTLSDKYPTPPKCVYALLMGNGTVKIGVTQNFDRRINTISTSSGLEIVKWCHTEYLPKRKAFSIENTCHRVFASRRTKGEFFDIPYETACDELAKHAQLSFINQRLLES